MSDPAIQVEGIKKSYGALQVLRGVDLAIPAGQFAAIIGKSGSGKSTLLGIMSGLEVADEGRVLIWGKHLAGLSDADMADLRRQSIGIVFQGFNLIPSLSALENVLLPTFFDHRTSAAGRRQRGIDLLAQVGLSERMHHRPSALSGGEQQRVAIARALVNRPSILLADEPTGNLDQDTGAAILDLLLELGRAHGTTLLMVTHDRDVAGRADTIIEMKDGTIGNGQTHNVGVAASNQEAFRHAHA
jgi:putative ABC transport system ATP-binding protein